MKGLRIIDATHVVSEGGKVILKTVLDTLDLSEKDFLLYSGIDEIRTNARVILVQSEIQRIVWYISNGFRHKSHRVINLNSSICIGALGFINVVYFHNVLFFERRLVKTYQKLTLSLCSNYQYFTQTKYSQHILWTSIGVKSKLLPFYRGIDAHSDRRKNNIKRIFHISSKSPHKQNHFLEELIEDFKEEGYSIYSTIDYTAKSGVISLKDIPNDELLKNFDEGGILLNTSGIESLCLPLIECAQRGLTIITYDAPYVREVVDNVYFFKNLAQLKDIVRGGITEKPSRLVVANEIEKLNELL